MGVDDPYRHGFDESTGKSLATDRCPECEGDLVTDAGETRCTECGLVLDEHRIDHGPEWTDFGDDPDESSGARTGAPLTPTRHDRGLSTEIGRKQDGKGNPLSGAKRRRINRWRREHKRGRFQSTAERNLAHACTEIARLTSALELPQSVQTEATRIYREAQREDLIQGRSIETMAAGAVYAACRCRGHPRTVGELADVAPVGNSKIDLGYGVLNTELGLSTQPLRPQDRIPHLASACDAPDATQHRALELARCAEETGIANGRTPSGVAAACLYLAGQERGGRYTQHELADLANVSAVTVRARYRELHEQVL